MTAYPIAKASLHLTLPQFQHNLPNPDSAIADCSYSHQFYRAQALRPYVRATNVAIACSILVNSIMRSQVVPISVNCIGRTSRQQTVRSQVPFRSM